MRASPRPQDAWPGGRTQTTDELADELGPIASPARIAHHGLRMIIETCQRWTLGRETRRPAGELIQTSAYDVVPLDEWSTARDFVAAHHYARTASPTSHSFGLYCRGDLVGVALFGPPASMNAHRAVWPTLEIHEAVTLGRLVLRDEVPGNAESWFIGRCLEMLARRGIVGVESCADPQPRVRADGSRVHRGHLGIVYQATNGIFRGKTNPATLRLLPDGSVLNNRAQGKLVRGERGGELAITELVRWGARPPDGEDVLAWLRQWREKLTRSMRHFGNLRYLWCLNPRRRTELLGYGPRLAYPKAESLKSLN